MVKTEVSARVSSWLFFLNRGRLVGKRGNIPSGERAAGWHKCSLLRSLTVIASAAKRSRIPPRQWTGLLRCVRNDGVHTLTSVAATDDILKVFCPTEQADFFFDENNPMHSRTAVDFQGKIVGWVSERLRRAQSAGVTHLFGFHGRRSGCSPDERSDIRDFANTVPGVASLTRATKLPYSAAICRGAGGGLARSAASWA